ncbi:hypothetical protein DFH28DRAFT_1173001 [Melampsora americana]|nr:hypothetical protein DFH28DRAFT_1172995 [Melampsora americana]KAH9823463.1 hypothetical protein DFH28DRAFT_1173001 [Melampsora americana]
MDNNKQDLTLPVPAPIEIHHKDRRQMDDYVDAFPAAHYGYRIRIGHSSLNRSPVSHYECYRSGKPSRRPQTLGNTRSARIDCPFRLSTRYLYHKASWILIHTHTGHNHPPDPNVKPCKKTRSPKPILAPGVLDDEPPDSNHTDAAPPQLPCYDVQQHASHNSTESTLKSTLTPVDPNDKEFQLPQQTYHPNKQPASPRSFQALEPTLPKVAADTTDPKSPDQCFQDDHKPRSFHDLDLLLELDIQRINSKLRAMPQLSRQAALKKIELILGDECVGECSPPDNNQIDASRTDEQPISNEFPPLHDQHNIEESIDSLIEEFYRPSDASNSTFNFEDLILSQPTSQPTTNAAIAPSAETLPISTPPDNIKPDTSSASPPPPPRVTRKRAREAPMMQKPNVINPNLPALLAKYRLHAWLEPYIIDVRDVEGDGHCGFRAIAQSIGQSQHEWLDIRQRLQDTVKSMPDDRVLPETRNKALARLATSQPNVLTQRKHWLSMPSWGVVIATTFDRPVLYYETGAYSQISFPLISPPNMNPPIVLAYANHHFVSLLLDFTRPNFPAPRLCATWRRFHSNQAARWMDFWLPLIESHAEFIKSQNQARPKRKTTPCAPISLSD